MQSGYLRALVPPIHLSGCGWAAATATPPLADELWVLNYAAVAAAGIAIYALVQRVARRRVRAENLIAERRLAEEHSYFLAATESALDAFYIFDAARADDGRILDFTFRYVNASAERRLRRRRGDLLGRHLCLEIPLIRTRGLFDLYCQVVETGVPAVKEFSVDNDVVGVQWARHQIVKLGDGVAVTSSDRSAFKSIEGEYKTLAEFNDSIFESAPFSIIATDAAGTITAMNLQAEGLTGYAREELVGRQTLLVLHDPEELRQRAAHVAAELGLEATGVDLIAMQAADGGIREEEWTYIRRDGTRSPVNLAVKVLRSASGERKGMIGIAQDATSRRQMMSYATQTLTHDPLTGLVGRRLLEDRMEQTLQRAKRAGTKVAIYVIDLDGFKALNDSLGHRAGDEVLTLAARRLLSMLRSSDTVARMGGDEFVVLIYDLADMAAIECCAEKLLRAIALPFKVKTSELIVTASVGCCVYPELAGTVEQLLQRSDAAMNAAKEAGRNRFQVFDGSMLQGASSRLSMEGALREALNREELFLNYQPQTSLPDGRVIGMEALLRWKHPQFGLVSPAHFIPMAEELGLMPEFGAWAMHRACADARRLQMELGRRLMVSVNLSPYQFQQRCLVRSIEEALKVSGLAAEDLEIEITENTLMVNSTANLEMLASIRNLGVRLSIDDFGTGFSSFSYLLQYQVDRLKIDQSFVRQAVMDANAAAVVRTIIAMSHGLGIKVIAEGVETEDQLRFLLRRHCNEAQGYYFARPVAVESFAETVERVEALQMEKFAGEVDALPTQFTLRLDDFLEPAAGRSGPAKRAQ